MRCYSVLALAAEGPCYAVRRAGEYCVGKVTPGRFQLGLSLLQLRLGRFLLSPEYRLVDYEQHLPFPDTLSLLIILMPAGGKRQKKKCETKTLFHTHSAKYCDKTIRYRTHKKQKDR